MGIKIMKIRYSIAVFWILFGLTSVAGAEPPWGMPFRKPEGFWKFEDQILEKIGVTNEQKVKIEKLRDKLRADIEPLKSQRYEIFAEMRLLWMDPDSESEKIWAKSKALHELIWRLIEKEIEYKIELRNLLSKEQHFKLIEVGGFR
jgi:Spy/CpxP family protein refolding chaperone